MSTKKHENHAHSSTTTDAPPDEPKPAPAPPPPPTRDEKKHYISSTGTDSVDEETYRKLKLTA